MKLVALSVLVLLFASQSDAEVILTITKTPYEAITCSMDFTQVIGTDGTTLVSVTSVNLKTGADSTAEIVDASAPPAVVPATAKITFRVKGGSIGDLHQVSVKVTDSTTGDQFEGDMMLKISTT